MLDEKYDWNSILFQFRLMLDNEFVNYFLQSIFTDIYSHSIKIKTFMGKFSYYYNKDVIFVSTKTQTALHNYKTLKRRIVIDGFLDWEQVFFPFCIAWCCPNSTKSEKCFFLPIQPNISCFWLSLLHCLPALSDYWFDGVLSVAEAGFRKFKENCLVS